MSEFSQRLVNARNILGWSRKRAVSEIGIPYPTYSGYEQGLREPDIKTMAKIATALHTTTDYLSGKTDNPNIPGTQSPTSQDLDKMLDDARSYDGKPMTKHDRVLIKQYLEALYGDR